MNEHEKLILERIQETSIKYSMKISDNLISIYDAISYNGENQEDVCYPFEHKLSEDFMAKLLENWKDKTKIALSKDEKECKITFALTHGNT